MKHKRNMVTAAYALFAFLFLAFALDSAYADCINLKFNKSGGSRVKVTFQVFNDGDEIMLVARKTEIGYVSRGEQTIFHACHDSMKDNWLYKALIRLDSTSSSWTAGRVVGNLPINSNVVCNQSDAQFGCHRE